jgi:hypothetical protein
MAPVTATAGRSQPVCGERVAVLEPAAQVLRPGEPGGLGDQNRVQVHADELDPVAEPPGRGALLSNCDMRPTSDLGPNERAGNGEFQ